MNDSDDTNTMAADHAAAQEATLRAGTLAIGTPSGLLPDGQPVEPHQSRVIVEHDDLEDKVKKLGEFIGAEKFYTLAHDEQDRLQAQFGHMLGYLRAIKARIAAWTTSDKGVTHVAATDTEPERVIPNA
jgi:hypothetical protein